MILIPLSVAYSLAKWKTLEVVPMLIDLFDDCQINYKDIMNNKKCDDIHLYTKYYDITISRESNFKLN